MTARKRAKTLTDNQLVKLFEHIDKTSYFPERDKLMIALSFKAGLRAKEISQIDFSDMQDAEGKFIDTIRVEPHVGKYKQAREVPMHPLVKRALKAFLKAYPNAKFPAVSHKKFIWKLRRGERIPANAEFDRMTPKAVVVYLNRLMDDAGFQGATSHSGRRTFGTSAARKANKMGCSLRDVQILLGHSDLRTTAHYIELSDGAHKLIAAL